MNRTQKKLLALQGKIAGINEEIRRIGEMLQCSQYHWNLLPCFILSVNGHWQIR
jgi:hypothetical protein